MQKCIRVGIADDDEIIRVVLIRALGTSEDLRVVAAVANGEEAVHLASSGRIDVLVLDVEMPGMTGAQALPIVRAVAPDVKVVMHSRRCAEQEQGLLAAGAAACLAKPCAVTRMMEVIRRAAAGESIDAIGC